MATPLILKKVNDVFEDIGNYVFRMTETAGRAMLLMVAAFKQMSPKNIGRNTDKIIMQMFLCGVAAIPVTTLTAAFTGMVLAAQTGNEIKKFGLAAMAMGPIVGGSVLREMGPLLTAICVAGFVGGGMSSVIATMRVNEEIDALEVMSINPIRYLVMPRLFAMIIVMPVLTLYSDIVGIMGGAIVSRFQVGVTFKDFFEYGQWALALRDVAFGIMKSVVFGILITIISCEQGYYATGGAEGVGRATMRSVVYSFLMILITNFLMFSLIFLTIFTRFWN